MLVKDVILSLWILSMMFRIMMNKCLTIYVDKAKYIFCYEAVTVEYKDKVKCNVTFRVSGVLAPWRECRFVSLYHIISDIMPMASGSME